MHVRHRKAAPMKVQAALTQDAEREQWAALRAAHGTDLAVLRYVLARLTTAPAAGPGSETIALNPGLPCMTLGCTNIATVGTAMPDWRNPGAWALMPMCRACTAATLKAYEEG